MSIPSEFARSLEPPYYAVIFSSQQSRTGDDEYALTAEKMSELAARQPGFLGIETVHGANGLGITISYWESEEAIAAWKTDAEHLAAQQRGKRDWYEHYEVRVARVERAYSWSRTPVRG
jgi:heme-degrading monooxygenase HmoA